MKIAVITASLGGIDKPLPFVDQDIEFTRFYITEQNAFPFHTVNSRLAAKFYKILSHRFVPNYDVFVWIDGNVEVKDPGLIRSMVSQLENADVVISEHPQRSSIRQEADFIINEVNNGNAYLQTRYSAKSINDEANAYGDLDGLYWCGLFARRNETTVNKAFDDWFVKNVQWSNFDQLSFVKIVHDFRLRLSITEWGPFYNNNHYSLHKHKKLI